MSFCAICAKPTSTKCSRCKSVYYCGRECQTTGWRSHKTICNIPTLSNNSDAAEQKLCNNCARPADFSCNDCSNGIYCSETCQVRHWEVHQIFHRDKNTIPSLKDISTGKVVNRTTRTETTKHKPKDKLKIDIKLIDIHRVKLFFNEDNIFPILNLEGQYDCSICMEPVLTEYDSCVLPCHHIFHDTCFEKYEKTTKNYNCPLCRNKFDKFEDICTSIKDLKYDNSFYSLSPEQFNILYHKYLLAAKRGDVFASFNLGMLYSYEKFEKYNNIMALKWFHIALYKGYPRCEIDILVCYYYIKDNDKIVFWSKRIAETKYLEGSKEFKVCVHTQFELGRMYEEGRYVPKNYDKMYKYYKMAADNGDAFSQYKMFIFNNETDIKLAINYLLKSYKQNNSNALLMIGSYYMHGLQIDDKPFFKVDYKKGIELIEKAASLNNDTAFEYLARMYMIDTTFSKKDLKKVEMYINKISTPDIKNYVLLEYNKLKMT